MLIRRLKECQEFIGGDHSILRELLNSDKQEIATRYSLAHATVKPGEETQVHKLKTSEVYYILEGQGRMNVGDKSSQVWPGDTIYIPPDSKQFIQNVGDSDLKFLCIVDPAWRQEDEELL